MDATRKRRTKDRARQAWYARCRQRRFARFLGFAGSETALSRHPASQAADWRQLAPGAVFPRSQPVGTARMNIPDQTDWSDPAFPGFGRAHFCPGPYWVGLPWNPGESCGVE